MSGTEAQRSLRALTFVAKQLLQQLLFRTAVGVKHVYGVVIFRGELPLPVCRSPAVWQAWCWCPTCAASIPVLAEHLTKQSGAPVPVKRCWWKELKEHFTPNYRLCKRVRGGVDPVGDDGSQKGLEWVKMPGMWERKWISNLKRMNITSLQGMLESSVQIQMTSYQQHFHRFDILDRLMFNICTN